jgi:pantoate--beta-alanine ligase
MPQSPHIVATVESLRHVVSDWRRDGLTIALVPTMGALHEGHLSLCRLALARADRLIVSIFVNPTQFGPNEDYGAYPRPFDADLHKLSEIGAHALYAPTPDVMYPHGFATTVHVAGLSEGLCADVRPGHFDGVATIVAKLLLQCQPDIAVFGEKDYQQLQIIRRLAADLDLPVEIVPGPTLRERDGLALSSRNAYLTPAERQVAPHLNAALHAAAERLRAGDNAATACAAARASLVQAGFGPVDYIELRDAETLAPLERLDRPARLLAAAWLGNRARLIDNIAVAPATSSH